MRDAMFIVAVFWCIEHWYIFAALLVISIIWQIIRIHSANSSTDDCEEVMRRCEISKSSPPPSPYTHSTTQTSIRSHGQPNGRKLIDHYLVTDDDWEKWYVVKGFTEGILRHLSNLERTVSSGGCSNPREIYNEWNEYYQKYRLYCTQYGIRNDLINDQNAFIPTDRQETLERQMLIEMEWKYNQACSNQELLMKLQDLITAYISSQDPKAVYRHKLINHLANGDPEAKNTLSKQYKTLLKSGFLREKQDETKHFQVFLARPKRIRKEKGIRDILPPSSYDALMYSTTTTRKTEYKVYYTVEAPISVDIEYNAGSFVSQSSGETYHTSLSKCTCPAWHPGNNPCKHMVALAAYLNLYTPFTIEGKSWQSKHNINNQRDIEQKREIEISVSAPVSPKEEEQRASLNALVRSYPSKPKTICIEDSYASADDFLVHAKQVGLDIVDKRSNGGCLWFRSTPEADEILTDVIISGKMPVKVKSTRNFNGESGWFIN